MPVLSPASGFVESIQCEQVGIASLVLGGGREKKEDVIDPAVGLVLHKKVGDPVQKGEAVLHRLLQLGRPARQRAESAATGVSYRAKSRRLCDGH